MLLENREKLLRTLACVADSLCDCRDSEEGKKGKT